MVDVSLKDSCNHCLKKIKAVRSHCWNCGSWNEVCDPFALNEVITMCFFDWTGINKLNLYAAHKQDYSIEEHLNSPACATIWIQFLKLFSSKSCGSQSRDRVVKTTGKANQLILHYKEAWILLSTQFIVHSLKSWFFFLWWCFNFSLVYVSTLQSNIFGEYFLANKLSIEKKN